MKKGRTEKPQQSSFDPNHLIAFTERLTELLIVLLVIVMLVVMVILFT